MTVLGLTTEGPEDTLVAENLTAVLRRAVEEDRSVRHSGRESTLAQMSLAFGCEDQRDAGCLQQIGQELQSQRLLSGAITRTARSGDWAFRVEVWLFDVESGHELSTASAQFGRSRSDIDDLRDVARGLVRHLLGGETGRVEVRTGIDGARVHVDGELAGETSDGRLVLEDVEVGDHHLEIDADGYDAYETTVTVHAGETARVRTRLVETGDGGDGGGGGDHGRRRRGGIGALQWVGIGALVAGAVLGVVAVAWAVDVNDTDQSASWAEYRHRFRQFDPGATAACDVTFSPEDRRDARFDGRLGMVGGEWELGLDPATGLPMLPHDRSDITVSRLQTDPLQPNEVTYNDNEGPTLTPDDVDSVCAHRTTQWIMGGLAVTAGLVGTYLVFGTGDSGPDPEQRATPDDDSARLQLMPIVSSEQRGLGLRLTF